MKKLIGIAVLMGLLFTFFTCLSSSDRNETEGRGGQKGDMVTVVGKIRFYPPISQDMSSSSPKYGKVYTVLKGKNGQAGAVIEGSYNRYFVAQVERSELSLTTVTTTLAAWRGCCITYKLDKKQVMVNMRPC